MRTSWAPTPASCQTTSSTVTATTSAVSPPSTDSCQGSGGQINLVCRDYTPLTVMVSPNIQKGVILLFVFTLCAVRMKVLYGSQSFITLLTKENFVTAGVKADIKVEHIDNAGHHIYSDQYKHFNNSVNNFCSPLD